MTKLMIAEKTKENDELKKSLEDLKKEKLILIFQNIKQRQASNKTRFKMVYLFMSNNAQNKVIKETQDENRKLTQELEKVKLEYEGVKSTISSITAGARSETED